MSPSPDIHPVRLARQAMRNSEGDSWRLEDLANAIGKSKSMLSNVEHGFVPGPQTRDKIAAALNTSVEELWPEEYT